MKTRAAVACKAGAPLTVETVDQEGPRAGEALEEIKATGSWQAIEGADAVVFLHDLSRVGEPAYDQAEAQIAAQIAAVLPAQVSVLHVFNKADLAGPVPAGLVLPADALTLSARTGQGLDTLRRALLQQAGWQAAPEGLYIARARHVDALRRTQAHLQLAQQHAAVRDAALDLLAEELRLAHRALGEITGAFSNEDLLGEIFSRFCIGK